MRTDQIIKVQGRVIGVLLFCLFAFLPLYSQPSWVKKATKSVFTLKTFAPDGSMIASTNGFFTGSNGEAVSNYTPFKGASRAIVIDPQGKEMPVLSIIGINDMYDVVKFRVEGKSQPLPLAASTASVGSHVWLLPYLETKTMKSGVIRKSEKFQEQYDYYTVAMTMPDNTVSCPLLNDAGEVLGMMQQPAASNDSLSYAVSAHFANALRIAGFGMSEASLQQTSIKKELPDDIKEANVAIYLASTMVDSLTYATMVHDFIAKFPDAPDGYSYRAQMEVNDGAFAAAERDMEQAIKLADKKDEAHFSYARLIYDKEIFQSDKPYTGWSLEKALSEVHTANDLNPQPTYRKLEGDILYAQQKYDEAYSVYHELLGSDLRSAELFYSAARCKEMLKDTTDMLALLDSTINTFSRPYLKEAAPYIWARAQARRSAGKYREAVSDMNDYEELMKATINDNFYYIRHQTDIEGRLYQQALNDIDRAIQLNPKETLYYAEKASLQVRVGLIDDAMATARECIALEPDNSDGYLFLGLAQCLKGQKAEGIANLQKAQSLGAPQAEELIEKYK
mgnify:CR=1 FL=1